MGQKAAGHDAATDGPGRLGGHARVQLQREEGHAAGLREHGLQDALLAVTGAADDVRAQDVQRLLAYSHFR